MLAFVGTVDSAPSFLSDYRQDGIQWSNKYGSGTGHGSLLLSKGRENYTLESDFKNGIPNGEAVLKKDDLIIANLSFRDGKRSGICSLKDNNGYLMFRGSFINDMKQGYGIVYAEGKPSLVGYYKDNQLSSMLFPFQDQWIEVSSDGMLLYAGAFSRESLSRVGIGAIFDNGRIQSVYDYDHRRQLKVFSEHKMTEYDEHGHTIYQGDFLNNYKARYPRHGKGKHIVSSTESYSGQFVNGKYEGEGILYLKNQPRYKGSWVQNHAEGHGVLFNTYGEVINQVVNFVNDYGRLRTGKWISIRTLEITDAAPSSCLRPGSLPEVDPPKWWLTKSVSDSLNQYFPGSIEDGVAEFDFNITITPEKDISFDDINVELGSSPQPPKPSSVLPTNSSPVPTNPLPRPKKAVVRTGAELDKLWYKEVCAETLQYLTLSDCREHHYSRFDFTAFLSLETLTIQQESCTYLNSLIVSNMTSLKSITIGSNSCLIDQAQSIQNIYFTNLPCLSSLEIGDYCFNNHKNVIFRGIVI